MSQQASGVFVGREPIQFLASMWAVVVLVHDLWQQCEQFRDCLPCVPGKHFPESADKALSDAIGLGPARADAHLTAAQFRSQVV